MNVCNPIQKYFSPVLLVSFFCLSVMSGCAKPYIQTPEIVGEHPATLKVDEESLKNKNFGTRIFSLYKKPVKCNGIGPAVKKVINLGRFYDESIWKVSKETEILLPVDSKIIVQAYYNSPSMSFISEFCDISIQFQPEPMAKYMFFTGREKEGGYSRVRENATQLSTGYFMRTKKRSYTRLSRFHMVHCHPSRHKTFFVIETETY